MPSFARATEEKEKASVLSRTRSRGARKILLTGLAAVLVATGSLLGISGPAWAAPPPTPDFGPAIEPLAPLVSQSTCDPTAKPGVVGFKDLLVGHYGHHNWNIDRPCSWGGPSEHKEGRALDFALNANNSTQNARANEILNWLLATDRHGNAHALARRFGIMYLIWNKRIWSASRASEGWRTAPALFRLEVFCPG